MPILEAHPDLSCNDNPDATGLYLIGNSGEGDGEVGRLARYLLVASLGATANRSAELHPDLLAFAVRTWSDQRSLVRIPRLLVGSVGVVLGKDAADNVNAGIELTQSLLDLPEPTDPLYDLRDEATPEWLTHDGFIADYRDGRVGAYVRPLTDDLANDLGILKGDPLPTELVREAGATSYAYRRTVYDNTAERNASPSVGAEETVLGKLTAAGEFQAVAILPY